MRSRRRFPSSGARGYTSLSCVVSPAPAAPSMPRASAAATAPSSIAPPPPSSACSTRTSLLFFSLFFSLPHLLSLSNTPKPGLFFWLCLSSEDEIDFKKISEEVGGGGDGGDVRCPETATGGAPSSPPSHCCQPYPSSSSSSHCGRPCSVAALSRPSSDDGHLVMNLDWQQCLPQSPYAFKSNTFICLGGWGSCFLSSKVTLLVLMPLPNLEVDERLIPVFYIVCISSLKDCRPSKLSPIPLSSKPLLGGSEG
uniref:Uncharacterized protein LOC105042550 isoform X1 n=1 Tax=Elaeis guineensis var. tenera TaxID=51953 RepID=A0A6I9R5J5_ELAGV|nr:uncharacterized protein LOC105042550 isoform X1 [Elaeis guineensis]